MTKGRYLINIKLLKIKLAALTYVNIVLFKNTCFFFRGAGAWGE